MLRRKSGSLSIRFMANNSTVDIGEPFLSRYVHEDLAHWSREGTFRSAPVCGSLQPLLSRTLEL